MKNAAGWVLTILAVTIAVPAIALAYLAESVGDAAEDWLGD